MRLDGPLDLPALLHGGQAFRWTRRAGDHEGVIGERVVRFAPRPDGGVEARAWPAAPRTFFARYLRLEPQTEARLARLRGDPVLAPTLAVHPGLRLLRQDPWETTVAFITSANNHVLRIEGILRAIAARWGDPLPPPDASAGPFHAFPPPHRLARASEAALRATGLGYRAPFVRRTARLVAGGEVDLNGLRGAPLDEAREALLALPGVGPKVADCIALFSLDADGAFPVDRWVLRAMGDAFFGGALRKPAEVEAFARARWGDDAGLAQQVLFHAIRLRNAAPGTTRLAPAGGQA